MPEPLGPRHPQILSTPVCLFQGGFSLRGQGGEACMKPREGKHAPNPKGFPGGGTAPVGGSSTPRGGLPGSSVFTREVRVFRGAPAMRGPLFASPGRHRTFCSRPGAARHRPPSEGYVGVATLYGCYTSGKFSGIAYILVISTYTYRVQGRAALQLFECSATLAPRRLRQSGFYTLPGRPHPHSSQPWADSASLGPP